MIRKNSEYWQRRQEKMLHSIYNRQEKHTVKLLRTYKQAHKEMQAYMDMVYRKYLVNGISLSEIYKYNRYDKMIAKIKKIVSGLDKQEKKHMQVKLIDYYIESAMKTGEIIEKFGESTIKVDFSIVPKKQIERSVNYPWSGADYSTRIWDNKKKLIKNLSETVTQGIVQGKSNTQMAKKLKEVMGKGAYDCRRLVRSETMHVVNSAAYDTYKKAEIKRVEVIVAEDERLCEECSSKAGIYIIDKAPMLPIHANCRCTIVPVIE